jgi:hypothetical protein
VVDLLVCVVMFVGAFVDGVGVVLGRCHSFNRERISRYLLLTGNPSAARAFSTIAHLACQVARTPVSRAEMAQQAEPRGQLPRSVEWQKMVSPPH